MDLLKRREPALIDCRSFRPSACWGIAGSSRALVACLVSPPDHHLRCRYWIARKHARPATALLAFPVCRTFAAFCLGRREKTLELHVRLTGGPAELLTHELPLDHSIVTFEEDRRN